MLQVTFPVDGPLDLGVTLAAVRHGQHDPTIRIEGDTVWRATRTSDGPALVRLRTRPRGVEATAWGDGAAAALERAPALVGAGDDVTTFRPDHPVLRALQRRLPGLRMTRTGGLLEALIPAIVEQKVSGLEAWRSYGSLIRALGERAPGPAEAGPLVVPPPAEMLAALPYHAYHRFGLERRRADAIRHVAAVGPRLEQLAHRPSAQVAAALCSVHGIGAWTAAEVVRVTLGDADAVSVGDYNLPSMVAWVLAGEPHADDARMLELLEPYRGHRARVVRLLELGGAYRERRAPRMAVRSIERI